MMNNKNSLIAALCCAAVLVSGSVASAQEIPQRRSFEAIPKMTESLKKLEVPASKGPESKAQANTNSANGNIIEMFMHKAKVVTLPRGAAKFVVGDPSVVDVEEDVRQDESTTIILRPKAVGLSNIFFLDQNGEIISKAEVRVVFDNQGIKAALDKLLPSANIKVSAYRNSVFLTGGVPSASLADNAVRIAAQFVAKPVDVVNMMTVSGGQQVILQVRVAEMDRTVRKNLAVDTVLSKRFTNLGGRGFDVRGAAPANILDGTSYVTGTLFTGTNILGNATFEALERQTLAKTLAEPTLTALSGENATFLAGGEFPFQSGVDSNGNATFEYREFGIRLGFTPVVLDKGRINLKLATEISALGDLVTVGSVTVQSLTQKKTTTTVEMPSGGTLMISGLLQDDMSDAINGAPFLKDVPILGALFRSTGFIQQRTELVITVTAYLVKPIDNARAASLPTDGFEEATDLDLYVWGRLHRHYSNSEETFWDNPLKGPFGYIMK